VHLALRRALSSGVCTATMSTPPAIDARRYVSTCFMEFLRSSHFNGVYAGADAQDIRWFTSFSAAPGLFALFLIGAAKLFG